MAKVYFERLYAGILRRVIKGDLAMKLLFKPIFQTRRHTSIFNGDSRELISIEGMMTEIKAKV